MLIETLSQRPTIISGTHGAIVRHLLPAMARCLEGTRVASTPLSSEGGNYLLLSLRIISDLLSNVLRVHKLHRTLESKDGANAAHDDAVYSFVCQYLLPKYSTLLGGASPDPLPQLALKILCMMLDRDQQVDRKQSFVSVLHDMRLIRRIITNLSHKTALSDEGVESESGTYQRNHLEASVHAARALWYILRWENTSMLELHRFDIVHRLRKAIVAAWHQNATTCYEPLLACTEAVLLHACNMIRNSFGSEDRSRTVGHNKLEGRLAPTSLTSEDVLLNLKEVREYCRDLLRPEYVLIISKLVADHAGESHAAAEEIRLRASQCLLLMGQFLGAEFFDVLANDDCLTAIGKALTLRHGHVKMPGQHDGRNVSMIMRLLQLLVFALETGNASLITVSHGT